MVIKGGGGEVEQYASIAQGLHLSVTLTLSLSYHDDCAVLSRWFPLNEETSSLLKLSVFVYLLSSLIWTKDLNCRRRVLEGSSCANTWNVVAFQRFPNLTFTLPIWSPILLLLLFQAACGLCLSWRLFLNFLDLPFHGSCAWMWLLLTLLQGLPRRLISLITQSFG